MPDQGANRNTFFADANLDVGPTNSNSNATFKTRRATFSLSTGGQTLVKKDSMTTTVTVPGGGVGAISISEEDCDPDACIGQIATVHVRDGAPQTPYLEWTLVVVGSIDGIITHVLDTDADGTIESRSRRRARDNASRRRLHRRRMIKNGNVSTIVFRTATNGRVQRN